ncbi:MAG: IS630 family transposase [ANME-2 cluster archaeon]|nr:IS630 family transposase [ANME-2 cluster archaeon]MDT8309709.1 IS630 family transposase [Bacteroidales bacterium]
MEYYSQQKGTVLLFFDPCHLLHTVVNVRKGQLRVKKGTITIKSNTGRKRINILEALDIENFSVTTTLTEETCDSVRVVEFLQKIKEKYPDRKIVVVLDNARYNYAIATRAFAEECTILLLFLPPYAPNHNRIERLWKFTKKRLVNNPYHEDFTQFVNATDSFFNNLGDYHQELSSLFTKKLKIVHAE